MNNLKQLVRFRPNQRKTSMPVLTQEREIMKVGANHGWSFRIMGVAPVPTVPILYNQWWLIPLAQDHSAIPARALERVQAIYETGIRPKAFVIAHEAPRQLPAPANAPKVSPLAFWSRRLAEQSLGTLKMTGTVLGTVVVPTAIAVLGVMLSVLGGVATAVAVDPMLIAVTEDDVWIMLDFWMTE